MEISREQLRKLREEEREASLQRATLAGRVQELHDAWVEFLRGVVAATRNLWLFAVASWAVRSACTGLTAGRRRAALDAPSARMRRPRARTQ